METNWEQELGGLFEELSDAQGELITLLSDKGRHLAASDEDSLSKLQQREEELVARLQRCHDRRGALLEQAEAQGLPSDSLQSLASALSPSPRRREIDAQLQQSASQSRLLRHHSLTNWVVVQRTLLHLSQMLEIIATGGRLQPTYGKDASQHATGALVDREV